MNSNEMLRSLRDFIYLRDSDLNIIANSYEINNVSLFKKFMEFKSLTYEMIKDYNIKFISLGLNCLPHTISIWSGLKAPNYILNQSRLPFDMAVHKLSTLAKFLDNKFSGYSCDNVYENYFVSDKYELKFNHDYIDNRLSIQSNIDNFNAFLNKRTERFISIAESGNNVFLLAVHDFSVDLLNLVSSALISYNKTNKLIILNTGKTDAKYDSLICARYPLGGYVWYNNEHNLSDVGYKYESSLILNIIRNINEKFNLQKQNQSVCCKDNETSNLDYYRLSQNSVHYYRILIERNIAIKRFDRCIDILDENDWLLNDKRIATSLIKNAMFFPDRIKNKIKEENLNNKK